MKKNAFEIAKIYNNRVANLKDSVLFLSKNGRELRALAAEAVDTPIVGTAKEIGEKYGKYFSSTANWESVADHDPEDVFVWAFDSAKPSHSTSPRREISLVPIDVVEAYEPEITADEIQTVLSEEEGLEEVEIVKAWELPYNAELVLVKLTFETNDLTIPVVHHKGQDWLITPWDWQEDFSRICPEDVENHNWRYNITDEEAVVYEGVPMMPFYAPEIEEDTPRKRIGDMIREAREERRMSIRDLAAAAGVSKNNVARVEGGKYNYTIDVLSAIAKVLGLDVTLE